MKKQMTCEEVQKNIPAFINQSMDSQAAKAFIKHVRNCKSCTEELSVEYLVLVGVKRLDSASAFNLNDELDELIERNRQKANRRQNISWFIFVVALVAAVVGGYFLSGVFR